MREIVCIDGPSGAGKGTVSRMVAKHLDFNYLDSGALYRVLAVRASDMGLDESNLEAIAELATQMGVTFVDDAVIYAGEDISPAIRTEESGAMASRFAAFPEIRTALLQAQKNYASAGGLVADGRDMGTVVFPDARLKIFLLASAEERARRRYQQLQQSGHAKASKSDANQLIHKGDNDSLRALVEEIRIRDERDSSRKVSPLRPAEDAIEIDSTSMAIEEVVALVLSYWNQKLVTPD